MTEIIEQEPESEKKPIKASDLLLEISDKTEKILQYITNIDFNYKILLSRLSEQPNLKPSESKPEANFKAELPSPTISDTDNSSAVGKKKISIQQKIVYPNDKPAPLARVRIFDSSKKELKETKTNHTGKWNASLDPGNYFIHITKAETGEKPKLDHYYEITVPNSNTSIELEIKK